MFKMISLFLYGLLSFESLLCVCFQFFLDIEAIGSSEIIEDYHHTIELYFGTF
ncbi:hypothetical protein F383_18966 [Gossypium arboreum]|uniref:Uncharacterized protein n=1 Tax=Gossypium arboreum TaxID=29729 RepID=A0A0B0NI54_GOSAR|nr:hypothetical protein F383_18966 [Gossypium arboreum]